jgi:hypothetical protein
MKALTGNDPTGDPLALAKSMLDSFHQGVALGETREGNTEGGNGNSVMPVVEKALDIFGKMVAQHRLARPAPPGAPPPRQPSEATVVEPAATNGHTPAPAAASATPEHRWHTAVETLYRGMLNGRLPEDIAASLGDMLDPSEVAMLVGEPGAEPTAEQVLEYLAPLMAEFPQLATTQGKVYTTSVLVALRAQEREAVAE